jgi:DNA-binding protein YbaB
VAQTADRDANRALRARFDDVYSQYERLRSGMGELQQKLADMTVSAESPDGLVKATVGPRGQLVDLKLDQRIYRTDDARHLARTIVETVQRAAGKVTDEVQELVSGYLPADSAAASFLRDGDFDTLLARQDRVMREAAEGHGR